MNFYIKILLLLGLVVGFSTELISQNFSDLHLKERFEEGSSGFITPAITKEVPTPLNYQFNFYYKFQDQGYILSWHAMLTMYRATGDKAYLIRFMEIAIWVIKNRRDIQPFICNSSVGVDPNLLFWFEAEVTLGNCNTASGPFSPSTEPDVSNLNGNILLALSEFLFLIKTENLNGIQSESLIDKTTNLSILKNPDDAFTLNWLTYLDFANWLQVYTLESADYYHSRKYELNNFNYLYLDSYVDPVPEGINFQGPACSAYYFLYRVTNNPVYLEVANHCGTNYLGQRSTEVTNCNISGPAESPEPVFKIDPVYNALMWKYYGWRPYCNSSELADDDYEDISHALLSIQFILDTWKHPVPGSPSYFSQEFLERLHNTFTQKVIGNYLPTGCSTVHADVSGDDLINYDSGLPCNQPNTNNTCKETILSWMPLKDFDNSSSNVSGNVYEILLNFLKNNCVDDEFGGFTHLGLARCYQAQRENNMECINTFLSKRKMVYDQNLVFPNKVVVDPMNLATGNPYPINYMEPSFSAPSITEQKYTIENGVEVNLVAGESIRLMPGFHAKEGCKFRASIAPTGCTDGLRLAGQGAFQNQEENPDTSIAIQKEFFNPNNSSFNFIAFPNPSSGKFNLSLNGNWKFPVQVKVWSVLGQEVFRKNVFQEVSEMNLSGIGAGVYFIEAACGAETKRTRVVIE